MVEYFRPVGPKIPEIFGPAGLKSNPDQKRLVYLVGGTIKQPGLKTSEIFGPAGPYSTRTEYFVTAQSIHGYLVVDE